MAHAADWESFSSLSSCHVLSYSFCFLEGRSTCVPMGFGLLEKTPPPPVTCALDDAMRRVSLVPIHAESLRTMLALYELLNPGSCVRGGRAALRYLIDGRPMGCVGQEVVPHVLLAQMRPFHPAWVRRLCSQKCDPL